MTTKSIALDIRFWAHSGIGAYLQTLVASLCRYSEDLQILLVGPQPFIQRIEKESGHDMCRGLFVFDAPMYSFKAQYHYPLRGDENLLLHYPHYNFPLRYRGKALVNVFDLAHWRMPENPKQKIYSGFFLWRLKRGRHPIIVPSDFIAQELEEWGIARSRIRVVPLTLHPDFQQVFEQRTGLVSPDQDTMQNGMDDLSASKSEDSQNAIPDQPYLLTVGIYKERKNYLFLLRALDYLWNEGGIEHHLVMAGLRPPDIKDLGKIVKHMRHADKVTLVPIMTRHRLIELMSGATTLVFPSLYEGFGLPVLEAMACGVPVVCSSAPPMKEIYGDTVLSFSPTEEESLIEALKLICGNSARRTALIKRGNEVCSRYSPSAFARSMLDIYHQI